MRSRVRKGLVSLFNRLDSTNEGESCEMRFWSKNKGQTASLDGWDWEDGLLQKQIKCQYFQDTFPSSFPVAKVTSLQGTVSPSKEVLISTPWVAPFLPFWGRWWRSASRNAPYPPFGHMGRMRGGNMRRKKQREDKIYSLPHIDTSSGSPSPAGEVYLCFYPLNKTSFMCLPQCFLGVLSLTLGKWDSDLISKNSISLRGAQEPVHV